MEAKREDWDFDPFTLQEADGYFRGRGVIDDKAMAAIFVANMIGYVQAGYRPDRDIILALTTDEELSDSPHNGVRWLLQHHRDLIDAELAINEGGGGALRNGKPLRLAVQLAEKVYQTYLLEVTDRGGHSASPRRDNPIYRLGDALHRLAQFDFPPRLNAVTRAFFERMAAIAIIPKGTAVLSPPSAINPEVMQTITQLSVEMWPGVPLNAAMSAGYTDSRWLRNAGIPAYGVSGLFSDPGNNGVHGRNEQVGVKAVYDGREFLYRLVQRLAGPAKPNP